MLDILEYWIKTLPLSDAQTKMFVRSSWRIQFDRPLLFAAHLPSDNNEKKKKVVPRLGPLILDDSINMSFLTKDQLDKYLDSLPNNSRSQSKTSSKRMSKAPASPTTNYQALKNELIYPLQNMSIVADENERPSHKGSSKNIEQEGYGSIKDRMRRLKEATGTVLSTTQSAIPAFPAPSKHLNDETTITISQPKKKVDAFEACLDPKVFQHSQQQMYRKPLENEAQQQPQQASAQASSPLSLKNFPLKNNSPNPPPPLPRMSNSSSNSSPPPAIPNSPRPSRPNKKTNNQQNDKVKTLNPIYAGLDCPKCHRPIAEEGEIVSVMEDKQIWHACCFTCTACHAPLDHVQYFEHDSKPYCEKDYKELFSLICDYCHEPIVNQAAIRALGKHFHEGHFRCSACQKPLGDQVAFLVHEEKPYCQEDYQKLFGKKCAGCKEPISGQYINALDQSWHPNCFVCTPYCEDDYHNSKQQFSSKQALPLNQQQQQSKKQPFTATDNETPNLKPKPSVPKKPAFIPAFSSSSISLSTPHSQNIAEPSSKNQQTNARSANQNDSNDSLNRMKRCHQCKEVIDGPFAQAFGHDYHIHHFQCFICSRALSSRVPGMWQDDGNGEIAFTTGYIK
ncbi:hypothetical protein BDF20DRAFT_833331 [Mycotypha africana]|uniref:uncharacterized protein n=1 Tax=Mycotypha africana TaxID=64632 RepID=UPI0022FFD9C5|nr:uncharacterized protein BDF20DRAFT_833331 [Mycotypha africana]KAI8988479.1 hypothetical protein BDF20DRAFT_833331 [Mycotypha africana]